MDWCKKKVDSNLNFCLDQLKQCVMTQNGRGSLPIVFGLVTDASELQS